MEIWAPIISCIGSIIAALIGATSSIIVARIQKEKTATKEEPVRAMQNTPAPYGQQLEVIETPAIKPSPTNAKNIEIEDKTATVLGITAIIMGVLILCTSLPSMLFSILAIIFGIVAIVSKKRWAGVTGIVLNGLGIVTTIITYIVAFSQNQ